MHPQTPQALAATLPLGARPTRDECVRKAGQRLAEAVARRDALTVEEAARQAYSPDSGPSLPELERRIRARRAGRTSIETAVAS